MDIELATQKMFEAFGPASLPAVVAVEPARTRARAVAARPAQKPQRKRPRCACGECATCKENARWERIFNEKFADPDYYRRPLTVCGSSLRSWG